MQLENWNSKMLKYSQVWAWMETAFGKHEVLNLLVIKVNF